MARRSSLLAPAIAKPPKQEDAPIVAQAETQSERLRPAGGRRPGKYHLGAYFDPSDPMVEAFRVLAARTRRTQQDLLSEAISELIAKYEADKQFGRA